MNDDKKITLTDKAMCQVSDGIKNIELFDLKSQLLKAKIEYENSLKKHKSNPFLD